MRRIFLSACILLAIAVAVSNLPAFPNFVNEIPNGTINGCTNCHPAGSSLNAFGLEVQRYFLTQPGMNGHVLWGPLLADYDADDDSVPNGVELQDRWGQWGTGQQSGGNPALVTLPGVTSSNMLKTLTLNLQNFVPHVGHPFFLRLVDRQTMSEVYRFKLDSVPGPNFTVTAHALLDSGYYNVDFWSDMNMNGHYDAPPMDHAWRIILNDTHNDTTINFPHTLSFTDIKWVYAATLRLTGFSEHIGQTLEARLVDQDSLREVGRTRIDSLPADAFMIRIPGMQFNRPYRLDFFVDFNKNGHYDVPPADHAWRLTFTNTLGDTSITFAHTTNTVDVDWGHLFHLGLHLMNPELNKRLEIRAWDPSNNQEVGRTILDSLWYPTMAVHVTGLKVGHNYNIDFWVDENNNGQYNAPPTDHAWRLTLHDTTGNAAMNFNWNSNYTDIQWPALAVEPWTARPAPQDFALAQNYPNPFNPSTRILYNIPKVCRVSLKVFNLSGHEVATLVDGPVLEGTHEAVWQAENLPSGIYLYRLNAGGWTDSGKMVLLK